MTTHTFVIAQDATESSVEDLAGHSILELQFPTMTGTTLTIQELGADGNYKTIGDASGNLSIVSPSTRLVHLSPSYTAFAGKIKLVSGTAEAAERTIVAKTASYIP